MIKLRSFLGSCVLHTKEKRFKPICEISSNSIREKLVSFRCGSCQEVVIKRLIEKASQTIDRRRNFVLEVDEFLEEKEKKF